MDETSKQYIKETRTPIPAQAGEVEKYDFEYERSNVSNIFIMSVPLEGWRHVKVTDQHTKIERAILMREFGV